MKPKELILKEVRRRRQIRSPDVVTLLRVSRQTAAEHLRALVDKGKLIRRGSTRNAAYVLPSKNSIQKSADRKLEIIRAVKGLEEHRVFSEMSLGLNLSRALRPRALSIAEYAFTEMLNNAIDHSKSQKVRIEVVLSRRSFSFVIRDFGVGVFRNLRERFRLQDSLEAVGHLLKGRQTTAPEKHSGEGIFFTSKAADLFELRSERIKLAMDNQREDQSVSTEKHFIRGTEVSFRVRRQTRRVLSELFAQYTNEDFEFDRTRVRVRLSEPKGAYVSRSEAKRLLSGLEAFKRVELDFRGVRGIGQGFADEVFRVFALSHPDIQVTALHTVPAVNMLIQRARKRLTGP